MQKGNKVCVRVHRTVVLRRDRFDEREKDFYDALYTQSQAQFDVYVSSGTVVNNYAHIFDLLIRLRQVCAPILFSLCFSLFSLLCSFSFACSFCWIFLVMLMRISARTRSDC